MTKKIKFVIATSSFWVALFFFSGCSYEPSVKIIEGKTFPVLQWEDIDGNQIDLDNGKVKLIQFWATWCSICRQSDGALNQLLTTYDTEHFQIVRISLDKNKYLVAEYLIDHPNEFINLFSTKKLDIFKNMAIPYTALLDQEGRVVFEKVGAINEPGSLAEKINKLINAD